MDTFLKAITKEFHTLFHHPSPDSPFRFIICYTYVRKCLTSLLEKGRMAQSLDCMTDVVRWCAPTSQFGGLGEA